MGLSASEIALVIDEIAPVLTGGWVQKIFQPSPRAITLEIRAPGKTLALLLSADPETARTHLLSRRLPNPAIPPPFCQFLRARIQGAHLDGAEQMAGDRIVRLRMTAREGPCSLIAELTGRRANLLLLDAADKILAALDTRHATVGQPYQRPPARAGAAREAVFERPPSPSEQNQAFPVSSAIESRYHERETRLAAERLREARLAEVRKAIRKAGRRVEALRSDLEKATCYREYARYGELLKANLNLMKKGLERVTVVDYFDPELPELSIPLDPSKGPQGNMDDYFKKHRKYLAADKEIRPRLESAERELEALSAELAAIQRGEWKPMQTESARSRRPLPRHQPSAISRQRPARSGPFRRFTSADGLPIYVGRNARENDELTFAFAHSDDLWLHARGAPGSHVVVRLEKGADPPRETVRDAATLALLYSDFKKSGKGEVIYTRRKWVKKMKGQPSGTVTVTQEKSVFVQLDRARLDRLKEYAG
jgi:predicted ribosome quality control (RQC) complex YloA/Tae2 family protein